MTGRVTAAVAGSIPAVALFRSLADQTRLHMVARLAAGEARVVDQTGEHVPVAAPVIAAA